MPYVENSGVRIHYHVEGNGPLLVLQHGFAMSLGRWREAGYVDALKSDYRVILIDARGHGASSKPYDIEAYSPESSVADVLAVLDALDVSKAHFWGYSMGGAIGMDVASDAPHRISSLIIGGAGADPNPSGAPEADPMVDALREGIESFVAFIENAVGTLTPEAKQTFLANDASALLASRMGRRSARRARPSISMPCLLYAGGADAARSAAKEYAATLPQGTFFDLQGLSNTQAFSRSDLVLPHVKKFLAEVSNA